MTAPPLARAVLTCLKKRRFSDEFAARAMAQTELQRQGKSDGLAVYKCPQCGGWHLTSNGRSKRYWNVTDTEVYPTLKGKPDGDR